jgi:perosamine synthetase
VGGLGHVGCLSFYGNKLITSGEGGMLMTDLEDVAATASALRNQARSGGGYWHPRLGFTYRLTNLQAAVGLAQLERVTEFVAARRQVARLYDELLAGTPGLVLHTEPNWGKSVCWLYSVLVEDEFGVDRDGLIAYLAQRGIESKPFFVPLPRLPIYADGQRYPVAEHLSQCGIHLPSSVKLQPQQIEHIVQVIKEAPRCIK